VVVCNRKITDEELVALARRGHSGAFDMLVSRYQEKIYRLARRLTRTQEDAEDVLQEAFVKAYQSLAEFRGTSGFYTWIYRITLNLALMKIRRERGRFVSMDEPIETERGALTRDFADAGPDPLSGLIEKERNHLLDKAINQLSPTSRAVFVLRHVEGLSTEDTGRILNLSPSATKSKLHRARLVLEKTLRAELGYLKKARPAARAALRRSGRSAASPRSSSPAAINSPV
jgi:RNA polymerase sigma-70 factor (ECF subfamily)